MRKRLAALFLLCALLLSGCSESNEVENLAYVLILGLDLMDDGQIRVCAQIPKITGKDDASRAFFRRCVSRCCRAAIRVRAAETTFSRIAEQWWDEAEPKLEPNSVKMVEGSPLVKISTNCEVVGTRTSSTTTRSRTK